MPSPKFKSVAESFEGSRVGETVSFLRRAMLFLEDLKRKSYPNASTLARLSGCSRSTAVRTIDRLRYEFGVPIEYEETYRGYYLTKDDFTLTLLPPSREELVVLCLLSDIARKIGDVSIREKIDSLWARVAAGRSDIQRDTIRERIIIEPEVMASLSGVNVLGLLVMCCQCTLVRVRYRSPWSGGDGVEYAGQFERVRISNGRVHTVFRRIDGERLVLNASFIVDVAAILGKVTDRGAVGTPRHLDEAWYSGIGSWSGAATEMIEVTIAAPAARYYGVQVWHTNQEDRWDGEMLVRRFPSPVSVELAERLLSLGRAVVAVSPSSVLERIKVDVANLKRLCAV